MDGLTGLWNRTYLREALGRAVADLRRHGRSFAVLMVDVDHFKACNDTHGHPFGDRVLQSIAEALQSSVREQDAVCRYGGDEFAVLLTDARAQDGERTAHRIHAALSRMLLAHEGVPVQVTVSIGICGVGGYEEADDPAEAVLEAADRALYKAKVGGRNRSCVAVPPPD